jgi:hypothetical protein
MTECWGDSTVTWNGSPGWTVEMEDDSGNVKISKWVPRNYIPEMSTLEVEIGGDEDD